MIPAIFYDQQRCTLPLLLIVSAVDTLCLPNCSCLRFESDARFFPPTGLCHVAIYISPEPELLGNLIEYAPWPHSFHTIYINSVGPHCCKFAGYGSAYFTYVKRNDIPSWSVLHSSFQVHSCSGRPHFVQTPCFANSIAHAFL